MSQTTSSTTLVEKIGRYLQYQRDKRGLSLAEFAKLLDIDASFLHRLEKGYYQSVSFDVAEKIAKGLHMNLEDLFTKCGIMPARCNLPTVEYFCKETFQFPEEAIKDLELFIAFLQIKYRDEIAIMKKKHEAYWKKKRAISSK